MALCSFSVTPSSNSALPQAHISPSITEAELLLRPLLPEGNLRNICYCLGIANGHLTPHPSQLIRGSCQPPALLPGMSSTPSNSTDVSVSLLACSLVK